MKRVVVILTLAAGAFGLGATGAPGHAIVAAVALLVPEGVESVPAVAPSPAVPREEG